MQVVVEEAEVRTAVKQPGVKPETPRRKYRLTFQADSEADFDKLNMLYETAIAMFELEGHPVVIEEAVEQADKAKAAQFN